MAGRRTGATATTRALTRDRHRSSSSCSPPRVDRIEAGGTSISALIESISGDVDRVIIDKTGFTALFNLLLEFAPAADPAASGPTLFTAVQEQLGLRLRPTSGPIDVLVIDRVERPSGN